MLKKIIRSQFAINSSANRIFDDDVDMKKIVLIEISKTRIFSAAFHFIQTMKMNIDRAQTAQTIFFVQNDEFDDEKKYQRFKKIEKKNQTNTKIESISKTKTCQLNIYYEIVF